MVVMEVLSKFAINYINKQFLFCFISFLCLLLKQKFYQFFKKMSKGHFKMLILKKITSYNKFILIYAVKYYTSQEI